MTSFAGAAAAVIDTLEADRAVWVAQAGEIGAIIARSQEAQHVEWRASSSGAFRDALAGWVRDGHDLMSLADDVIDALTAHIDALRAVVDALAAAAAAGGDGPGLPLPGLANPVPFGGLL
ncbi:hypothetical protein BJEO58_01728 [Brevibacterium jeotgali]|uniref:Uncharacterized protein n=1 Tax=Brevibacterium jeotgali TaxID=1262550 RepID=A0A2H1L5E8_9MICO|nr:hypothetical protein [Brevibacterium jeotgali]SMY12134.1 hypothetical protein BJEO58_01728 [Brevibacterium jeotgali]